MRNSFRKSKSTDSGQLIIISIIVMIISICDLFGLFDNIAFLKERISVIILLVLCTFIVLLAKVLKNINNKIDSYNDTESIEVLKFESIAKVYDYVSQRLLSTEKSVDDITWGSYTHYRTKQEQVAYDKYANTLKTVCKKGTVKYREISSLSDEHYFNRAINLFENYSYHLAYYDISDIEIPLISYVIIDSIEVIAGFCRIPGEKTPLENIFYLSTRHPLIVQFFKNYYDSIWDKGVILKEADCIDYEKIKLIASKLGIIVGSEKYRAIR